MVINLRTAKAIGHEVSTVIAARRIAVNIAKLPELLRRKEKIIVGTLRNTSLSEGDLILKRFRPFHPRPRPVAGFT
jgi:hypothetical protein